MEEAGGCCCADVLHAAPFLICKSKTHTYFYQEVFIFPEIFIGKSSALSGSVACDTVHQKTATAGNTLSQTHKPEPAGKSS